MSLTAWIGFTLAYGIMAVTPGPVTLLVVSYALAEGRRTALVVVAGTALGDATCLGAAVLGLGALLAASTTAFAVLKVAGGAYLVFLGIRLWRAPPVVEADIPAPSARPRSRIFWHAYLTTVLNPKSILFFMIFAPQFMNPRAALAPQLSIMLASVLISGLVVDGSYSLFAASCRRFIRGRRTRRAVHRVAGGVLVGEGILAAASRGLGL
jgi:homoserine/homoserine lactone efflux protein